MSRRRPRGAPRRARSARGRLRAGGRGGWRAPPPMPLDAPLMTLTPPGSTLMREGPVVSTGAAARRSPVRPGGQAIARPAPPLSRPAEAVDGHARRAAPQFAAAFPIKGGCPPGPLRAPWRGVLVRSARRILPGVRDVKALVKAKAEPGIWLSDEPVPVIGPEDVLVRVNKTGSAAPTSTSSAGTTGPAGRSRCRWWSAMNSRARSSRSARLSRRFKPACASRARVTWSARAAGRAAPENSTSIPRRAASA